MLEPQKTVVPGVMIAVTVSWLAARARPATRSGASSGVMSATFPVVTGGAPLEETAVFLDADHRLFGITSTLAGGACEGRMGVVLLNAGAVHHIGPNRLYVSLARHWATLGLEVLRLDMSGIGDSAPYPCETENVVYTHNADSDLRVALDFLRAKPGVVGCSAIGLCSGAYNAFKAAVHGLPLDSVVLINPRTFFRKPGMSAADVISESTRYQRRLRNLDAWKKLLRGEVNVLGALDIMTRRVAGIAGRQARDLARRVGRPSAGLACCLCLHRKNQGSRYSRNRVARRYRGFARAIA